MLVSLSDSRKARSPGGGLRIDPDSGARTLADAPPAPDWTGLRVWGLCEALCRIVTARPGLVQVRVRRVCVRAGSPHPYICV